MRFSRWLRCHNRFFLILATTITGAVYVLRCKLHHIRTRNVNTHLVTLTLPIYRPSNMYDILFEEKERKATKHLNEESKDWQANENSSIIANMATNRVWLCWLKSRCKVAKKSCILHFTLHFLRSAHTIDASICVFPINKIYFLQMQFAWFRPNMVQHFTWVASKHMVIGL